MLESVFIVTIIIGFLLTLYANETESVIFTSAGVIFWILIMANSLWVEVPFSGGDNTYSEYGFNVLCLIFVFINVIQLLRLVVDWRTQNIIE